MELLTSLLGEFEGYSLFLLLLLEGGFVFVILFLLFLGGLARLQSATRLPDRSRRISQYLEGLELSSLTTTHFCIRKTRWLAGRNNWGGKGECGQGQVRFAACQSS
jgi:hypothetical protein